MDPSKAKEEHLGIVDLFMFFFFLMGAYMIVMVVCTCWIDPNSSKPNVDLRNCTNRSHFNVDKSNLTYSNYM